MALPISKHNAQTFIDAIHLVMNSQVHDIFTKHNPLTVNIHKAVRLLANQEFGGPACDYLPLLTGLRNGLSIVYDGRSHTALQFNSPAAEYSVELKNRPVTIHDAKIGDVISYLAGEMGQSVVITKLEFGIIPADDKIEYTYISESSLFGRQYECNRTFFDRNNLTIIRNGIKIETINL